jgi:adhesin/invasin
VTLADPYTGKVFPGVTVTFSDGSKGGTFGTATVVTDSNGRASTTYTLPKLANKYIITASATGFATASLTEVATAGTATTLRRGNGNLQTTPILTTFPVALQVKAVDQYGNGVAGVTITYNDKTLGGTFSPVTAVTNSSGLVSSFYKASSHAGAITLYATATGLNAMNFSETVTPGPPAAISVVSGNNQTAANLTMLSQPLVVKVVDSYGNPVPNVSVTFSDGSAGGSFSANPVTTGTTGTASVNYTAGATGGTVTITATAAGVSTPATFTETIITVQ